MGKNNPLNNISKLNIDKKLLASMIMLNSVWEHWDYSSDNPEHKSEQFKRNRLAQLFKVEGAGPRSEVLLLKYLKLIGSDIFLPYLQKNSTLNR